MKFFDVQVLFSSLNFLSVLEMKKSHCSSFGGQLIFITTVYFKYSVYY